MDLDFSPRDAMNTKVTLFRRGENPAVDKGVVLYVSPNETNHSFFKLVASRLDINELGQIVNIDGDTISDVMLINQDDVLYALEKGESLSSPDSKAASTHQPNEETETEQMERVGSYWLGKFLGSGSFGKVHMGQHVMTNDKVALKFMRKSEMGTFQDAERVFTEIQCLNSLDHPNVIKLYQVINTQDDMVLALEYASGGDLKDLVEHYGPIDELNASRLFLQILDGVSYCHRHNIVHYDLKLENILLSYDAGGDSPLIPQCTAPIDIYNCEGLAVEPNKSVSTDHLKSVRMKIADFGLSQLCNPGQTSDYSAGSLAYIAPEVFAGGETAGPPRDVWAMGIILFGILCGRLPFMGKSKHQVIETIREAKLRLRENEKLSENSKQILTGMLHPNAQERMTVSEIRLMNWIDKGLPHTHTTEKSEKKEAVKSIKQHPPGHPVDSTQIKHPHRKVHQEISQDPNTNRTVIRPISPAVTPSNGFLPKIASATEPDVEPGIQK